MRSLIKAYAAIISSSSASAGLNGIVAAWWTDANGIFLTFHTEHKQ